MTPEISLIIGFVAGFITGLCVSKIYDDKIN